MASLLEKKIARAIYTGFKGKLLRGTLRRVVPGSGVDGYGDANPGTTPTFRFEGIREDYEAAYRAEAGIPDTDVRILIIAGSIKTDPRKGDQVFIQQQWHQVKKIAAIDPATATYELQATEIPDPTL